MITLNMPIPGHEYDILIENGLLDKTGEKCRDLLRHDAKVFIITDVNVAPLYAKRVADSLTSEGIINHTIILPSGEKTKSLYYLESVYMHLTDMKVTRNDCIIALGGGVIGDLAGFAAATILRGIDFIQIPTTLLAQVDSSVGGKVAVDLPSGKNLVGAFYQPKLVLTDPSVLETLNDREFAGGMAEVIKYGCIYDKPFFDRLAVMNNRSDVMSDIEEVIKTCCSIKADVVTKDEKEQGLRRILNFGHTLGHAYELAYNYEKYIHGEAIAAGMNIAARIGNILGITDSETVCRIKNITETFGLPASIECSLEDYERAVSLDKKAEGSSVTMVLVPEIGKTVFKAIEQKELIGLIEKAEEIK